MQSIPLFRHALASPSAFTPEALVAAVQAGRDSAAVHVPEICVLDFDGDITDALSLGRRAAPYANWACFHTSMSAVEVDGVTCGVIARTIGGPYAVLIAEQLMVSGARVILGLTSAGRVSKSLPVPSLVIADSAVRDEGTSCHYLAPSEIVEAPVGIQSFLGTELASVGLPVATGPVWTTDAPYRETREELEYYDAAGILAVEMQAASLFAFAQARKATVGVVAHVTNAIDHAGNDFEKGPDHVGLSLFEAICRAGARFLAQGGCCRNLDQST